MPSLATYARSIHSQNGEDGILQEIFRRLGIEKGVFCEFGAWDGKHLSNCYALYQQGWSGWYIEGDDARFRDLSRNFTADNVEAVHAFVAADGPNSLDALLSDSRLARQGLPELDLLSIDIDSDDLAIWRSVKAVRSKVVVIEFNPTIPIDVFFENRPKGSNRGNSARAIHETATALHYDLVAVTAGNMIFVDANLAHGIEILDFFDPSIDWGPRFFFGYDGTMFLARSGRGSIVTVPEAARVPWIGGVITQPVPRFFRRYAPPLYFKVLWLIVSYSRAIAWSPLALLRELRYRRGKTRQ